MAMRDSDTSLWLHNKLGTSNDSWISGSICSQLSKEVLRNIKECFPDLQTQVKLKLLLSLFHIPRRLIEEWKTELEEIIEVAGLDSELWVSMLSETMKTFPATGSLNTEISEYEETRPIFTDMVNDLRKMVSKHCDLAMLPLECQYLNKNALVSVVGQQHVPVRHFTVKRKPKSAQLRSDLLNKSQDAQSSLKKASAPTIPLRSRGMPRKMTDTTPLKGIPSRVPTSGFRSPHVPGNPQRPNLSRTPAGRKDGGIKLIELSEQPLGYAAAKKRKREQQLEEQAKKQEQKQNAAAVAAAVAAAAAAAAATAPANNTSPITSPTNNQNNGTVPVSPTTPKVEIKTEIRGASPLLANEGGFEQTENKMDETKAEANTPDYAPTLTYTQPPAATVEKMIEDVKSHSNSMPVMNNTPTKLVTETNKVSIQSQGNLNTLHQTPKRIKQEIEIQSDEIIKPSLIKIEKIEPIQSIVPQTLPLPTQQNQRTTTTNRPQQRIIIQQRNLQTTPHQQLPKQTITVRQNQHINSNAVPPPGTTIKMEKLDIKPLVRSSTAISQTTTATNTNSTSLTQQQLRQSLVNLPNNISVKITSSKKAPQMLLQQNQQQQLQQQQQQPQQILINQNTPVILASPPQQPTRQKQIVSTPTSATTQTIKNMPLSQLKTAANSGPVIISQTIIKAAKRPASNNTMQTQQQQHNIPQAQQSHQQTQYIITSQPQQISNIVPSLTSFAQTRPVQQNSIYQTTASVNTSPQTPTKFLLKTASSSGVVMTPMRSQQQAGTISSINPPPLIATSSQSNQQNPNILNIQNVQLPNRPVTIQPASQAAQQQHLQAQLQQQQQQQQQHPHTIVANTTATQQPKLAQVLVQQPSNTSATASAIGAANINNNVKNKTIILSQKGLILRNIGGDMYQQIPISNVGSLQNLNTGTAIMTTAAGPPSLVKTSSAANLQTQTIQLQQQPKAQQLPTLISTNSITPQHVIVQQQPSNIIPTQQTIIRPVMTNVQSGGLTTLPQGLTLIQRPGQQPQLVQVQTTPTQQHSQIQRTIISQPAQQQQQQLRTQQIVLQHKAGSQQPRLITTTTGATQPGQVTQQIQIQQSNPTITRQGTHIVQVSQQPQGVQQTQQQQQPPQQQRKGLSLSNEHVHKAHEMFRKANRVSRPDKALILGFMAGMRENPRPNNENVLVIKLGESEEKVQQEDGTTALCLVESHIRLDYNTGEWKTFQNYRRLDQTQGVQQQSSVVI